MNANTQPPGTSNADFMARRAAALPRASARPIRFCQQGAERRAVGCRGRRYIDFVAGIAVVNTGHCHPKVVAAAQAQIPLFSHTCFQVVAYDGYLRLAERLNALAPGNAPKKTFFLSTGAEAVENAIKIARAATGRPGVIAFQGGFHGRTLLALGLTGKIEPYKVGVGPFPAEIYHAPFPCELHGVSVDDAIRGVELLFKSDIEARRVAAFIVEPVQGEGGYYPAPPEFLQRLRSLADQHGILLIADEIQTGVARTGKMFAVEHSGVVPDLITMAKGLGGGFPIAAVVVVPTSWTRSTRAVLAAPTRARRWPARRRLRCSMWSSRRTCASAQPRSVSTCRCVCVSWRHARDPSARYAVSARWLQWSSSTTAIMRSRERICSRRSWRRRSSAVCCCSPAAFTAMCCD